MCARLLLVDAHCGCREGVCKSAQALSLSPQPDLSAFNRKFAARMPSYSAVHRTSMPTCVCKQGDAKVEDSRGCFVGLVVGEWRMGLLEFLTLLTRELALDWVGATK